MLAPIYIQLDRIGGLGDCIMLSNVVENCRIMGAKCVVNRNRPGLRQMFLHDRRCRTVARGPELEELVFRFNYWPVSGRDDFNGHMTEAAMIAAGFEGWYHYREDVFGVH